MILVRDNIEKAFKSNLQNGGSINDIAKLIVDAYKISIDNGQDSIGNKADNINYKLIENAIIAQFNLSYSSRQYLHFNLIEASLITAWSNASIILPAIPPLGLSLVISVSITGSTMPGTTPLIEASTGYDNIVNKFYTMFKTHAESINFLYTGVPLIVPPPVFVIPTSSYYIK